VVAFLQMKYSEFVHGLSTENVQLNRKVLSELAMHEPYSFKSLVEVAKRQNNIKHHSQL
jgi:large subunit ribosomal protein L20